LYGPVPKFGLYQSNVYGGVPPLAVIKAEPKPVSHAPVTVKVYAKVLPLLNGVDVGVGLGGIDVGVILGVGVIVGVIVGVVVMVGVGVGQGEYVSQSEQSVNVDK
jgi:hypothetical protein